LAPGHCKGYHRPERANEEPNQSMERLRRTLEGAIYTIASTVEIRDPTQPGIKAAGVQAGLYYSQ